MGQTIKYNMEFPKKQNNTTVNKKGWGDEHVIHSNSNYCVKILELNKGGKCSLHFHKIKEESFLVLEGKVQISLKYNLQEENIILNKGESIDIPPLLPHRFEALVDSKILEASNEDREEEDLVRVEPGDTQETPRLPISNRKFIEWEEKCNRMNGI